jgi:hypothetical protein
VGGASPAPDDRRASIIPAAFKFFGHLSTQGVAGLDDVYHPRSVLYFNDSHGATAAYPIASADSLDRSQWQSIAIDPYLDDPATDRSPQSLFVYPFSHCFLRMEQSGETGNDIVIFAEARYPFTQGRLTR